MWEETGDKIVPCTFMTLLFIISLYWQWHSTHASGIILSLCELQTGHSNQCAKNQILMHTINNRMDGSRFSSQGCCLAEVWKDVGIGVCQYVGLCFHAHPYLVYMFFGMPSQHLLTLMFLFEHNHTPSGKKTVTGMQVITASQVKSIGCRWQALFILPITEH